MHLAKKNRKVLADQQFRVNVALSLLYCCPKSIGVSFELDSELVRT